ncbi:hypothetical protein BGZ46_001435, partial [Entomortierella lignicola]
MRDRISMEGGREWDKFEKKYLTESSWKLGRELHDILVGRMSDMGVQTNEISIF